MSDSSHLSHRAVAASAAFLLTGAVFAGPAVADSDGKGAKLGGDRDAAASQGRSQGSQGAESRAKGDTGSTHRNGGDPAGNNGTFKVDGLPYSDGMGNEPHVSCGFRLEFYGFDAGQIGDVTIAGQAPSGSGTVSSRNDVLVSDDAAGGGANDPDAVVEYSAGDLNLSGLTAHPRQGYHLKVTLATDEGVKHKVFWIEPCVTGAARSAVDGTAARSGAVGGVVTQPALPGQAGGTSAERTAVLGTAFERDAQARAGTDARVLGTRFERGIGLPFTGSLTELLLAIGGGLVALGAGAWALGRRLRHVA